MNTEQSENETPKIRKEAPAGLRFLAGGLAVLFVAAAVAGLAGYDIWRVLFNPVLVKQTLTNEVLGSDLVPAVMQIFSEGRAQERVAKGESLSGVTEPDIVLLLSFVNMDQWRQIKKLLLSDSFLTHLVSVSVDGVYQWLDSPDPMPQIEWDMTPLKARLTGEEGKQAVLVGYSALPECTRKEIDDFTTRLSKMPPGVEVLYNLCRFPDPWREDQIGDYVNALIDVNQNVADRFSFSQLLADQKGASPVDPVGLKNSLRGLRLLAQWMWLAALLLLALVVVLGVRTLRSLGQFVGVPLLLSGILTLAVGLYGRTGISGLITGSLMSAASPLVRQEVGGSLNRLTAEIFTPLLVQGGILLLLGLVLIVIWIARNKTAGAASPVQS